MAEFTLESGHVVLIDDADYPAVSQLAWHISEPYVTGRSGRAGSYVFLHRYIMQAGKDERVRHLNGNRCDNRRENLVLKKNKTPPCPYRGVTHEPYRPHKTYLCRVKKRSKVIHYSYHETAIQAAQTYDIVAKSVSGRHAKLNFPEKTK